LMYVFTMQHGIGISPDSIFYSSTAENLYNGNGFVSFTQKPLVDYPLFYPLFLSAVMFITKHTILQFAPLLNSFLFALVVCITGWIIEKFTDSSKPYKWIVLSILVFSPSLIEIYSMLWSETVFILLSLLFFIAARNYYHHHSVSRLFILSFITAIAFVTRYAGITFVGAGGLLILFNIKSGLPKKIYHLFLFVITAISLATLNLMRNAVITGTAAGKRQAGITPLLKNLNYFGSVMCDWLSILREHYTLAIIIGIIILLVFGILFFVLHFSSSYYHSYEKIITAFFLVYTGFILVSSTLSRYEIINNRLLAPAFIPFILISGFIIHTLFKKIQVRWGQAIGIIAIGVFFLAFQYHQYIFDKQYYRDIVEDGIPGYTEGFWKSAPIVQLIQKDTLLQKHANRFFSNRNHAVYFFTGKKTETVPEKVHYREVKNFYTKTDFYIIWFLEDDNPDLLSIQEIKQHKKMDTVTAVKDGIIFHCTDYSK
jgi:hypothetical protein